MEKRNILETIYHRWGGGGEEMFRKNKYGGRIYLPSCFNTSQVEMFRADDYVCKKSKMKWILDSVNSDEMYSSQLITKAPNDLILLHLLEFR